MLLLNVDDDFDDREIFCGAVKAVDPNISCAQVESGISALEFLDQSDTLPDYLFMDMNMPKMTGIECVRKIRTIRRFLSMRIVMYSTTFSAHDENLFSEMGIEWLPKHSKFSDLVSSLKYLLSDETSDSGRITGNVDTARRECFSDRPRYGSFMSLGYLNGRPIEPPMWFLFDPPVN